MAKLFGESIELSELEQTKKFVESNFHHYLPENQAQVPFKFILTDKATGKIVGNLEYQAKVGNDPVKVESKANAPKLVGIDVEMELKNI